LGPRCSSAATGILVSFEYHLERGPDALARPDLHLHKDFILLFGMIWVRATFPRIRYDRLMAFGWKVLLPLSLALIFITATFILLAQQATIPCSCGASRWFLYWQACSRLRWCTVP